jgi:hypothetical protein
MKPLLAVLALVAAGCPDRSISAVDTVPAGVFSKDIPISADLDILFVIDNSGSTRDKQTIFADNYKNFVAALALFPTGLPNLHLAVVTTSVDVGVEGFGAACHPAAGQNGLMQNAALDASAPCPPPTTDRFLSDVARPDGSRLTNYQAADLAAALSCISHVGDAGCGFESPLEAMKRALDGSHPENAGFLRRGAFLAVVILTDEDDCSAGPAVFREPTSAVGKDDLRCAQTAYRCDQRISPSAPGKYTNCHVRHDGFLTNPSVYQDFLSGLRGPSGVAVAVIGGDPTTSIAIGPVTLPAVPPAEAVQLDLAVQPTCHATIKGNDTIGRPALRLAELVTGFGDRGLFRTVCQGDYSGALADIGTLVFNAISPCLEGAIDLRDRDEANPGLQPDCAVSDLVATDGGGDVETVIPRCHMIAAEDPDLADAPCWWIKAHPAACMTEAGLTAGSSTAARFPNRTPLPAATQKIRASTLDELAASRASASAWAAVLRSIRYIPSGNRNAWCVVRPFTVQTKPRSPIATANR